MSYPDPPSLNFSYRHYQQELGDDSFPGVEIDSDLDSLRDALVQVIDFLKGFTRSDGRLANASVRRETLGPDIRIGFNAPTAWSPNTDYQVSDTVFQGSGFYLCTIPHTSGVFATDIAAGRWQLLVDLNSASALVSGDNLSDLADPATARDNLGLGAVAVRDVVPVSEGGTGSSNVTQARATFGLGTMATQSASSVTITGGTINGVSLQSVVSQLEARNALGAASRSTTISTGTGLTGGGSLAQDRSISADVASKAEAEAGDVSSKLMTPLRTKQAFESFEAQIAIGGARWRDLISVRDKDVPYQNSTGRPIMVALSGDEGLLLEVRATVSDPWILVGRAPGANPDIMLTTIVPPGHYYRARGGDVILWAELR